MADPIRLRPGRYWPPNTRQPRPGARPPRDGRRSAFGLPLGPTPLDRTRAAPKVSASRNGSRGAGLRGTGLRGAVARCAGPKWPATDQSFAAVDRRPEATAPRDGKRAGAPAGCAPRCRRPRLTSLHGGGFGQRRDRDRNQMRREFGAGTAGTCLKSQSLEMTSRQWRKRIRHAYLLFGMPVEGGATGAPGTRRGPAKPWRTKGPKIVRTAPKQENLNSC